MAPRSLTCTAWGTRNGPTRKLRQSGNLETRSAVGPGLGLRAVAVVALSGTRWRSRSEEHRYPGSGPQTTAAQASKVDSIANMVPGHQVVGKLVVGVNVPYTPNEFKDPSGKIIGFDVDLMNAIAATLGLTPDYREADRRSSRPSRAAPSTSGCRRSPTPRNVRRPSTSSPTSRPARCGSACRGGHHPGHRVRQAGCGAGHHGPGDRRTAGPQQEVHRRGQSRPSRSSSSTVGQPPPTPWYWARPTRCRPIRR